MRTTILLALLVALPLAMAAHSPQGPCDGTSFRLGIVEITTHDPRATFYVDDRNVVFGENVWLYQESNGIWAGIDPAHDLQRGANHFFFSDTGYRDECVDDPNVLPDTLLY